MALGQVSRNFRARCEPLLFRKVALSDRNGYLRRVSTRMLYRLKNPHDSLTHHVRHLSVGYALNAASLPEGLLLQGLENIKGLISFTWCTWLPVPVAVLDCLQKVHPATHLKVVAHERNHLPLDVRLITSPQLHTLDINLSVLYTKTGAKRQNTSKYWGRMGWSELNHLKNLIIASRSLKVLSLKFCKIKHGSQAAQNQLKDSVPATYNPTSFKFEEHEMLPPLEELTLRDMSSNDKDHILPWKVWRAHQDWTQLRKLDLRLNPSQELLQSLVGAVPMLETLVVEVDGRFLYNHTLDIFEQFLRHLPKLNSLCVRGHCSKNVLEIIFHTVASQLTCLDVDIGSTLREWRRADFENVLSHCAKLERLSFQGCNELPNIEAEWTTAEANLPAEERVAQLVFSHDRSQKKMVYTHWHTVHGQRSKGTHYLTREYCIERTRPYCLTNTDRNSV